MFNLNLNLGMSRVDVDGEVTRQILKNATYSMILTQELNRIYEANLNNNYKYPVTLS